ncbi:MAG: Gfo/Idh/MocA family oxidoreductase [Candidatus Pacebacteria bacterium]|nr:Gfo/Idh/MocA family oxidoreductase [Candidatus Paceibacterota bacterium]MDD5722066.1 Gfo/Idh/MocA family oxidoreductase [Candidatus Paceibacterota bacterium]
MKILTGKKWQNGLLDYYCSKKEYRIQVLAWKNLEKIEGAYYIRPKSLKMALRYLPVVGFYGLFTKAWSRFREQRRNDKYVSCGIGKIIETGDNSEFKNNDIIAFIAPFHPHLVERLTLPQEFIFNIDKDILPQLSSKEILLYSLNQKGKSNHWWQDIISWSIYSGRDISQELKEKLEQGLIQEIKNTDWDNCEKINIQNPTVIKETKGEVKKLDSRKTGVLFGFGNYAKTNIISFMKPFVNITTIHEIDPTQIWQKSAQKWDASPFPRNNEKYDVYFVASYNHTHTPITLHALKQGAYAVVEKPVAMDYEELEEIEKAIKQFGPKVFIGFHKRYSVFNDWAKKDLGVKSGDPISYHSVVYEISQPKYFWYSWPISRSTFFANGCHQIDHFLHLNDFSQPKDFDIKLLQDNAIEVWIELENGAVFTTVFSEKGSTRIGPRDHVELKVPGRNIRITDNIFYLAEDETRIIRKRKMYKTNSYRDMYIKIGKRIANNEQGDSLKSIMISTKLMLDLEEKLQRQKGWGDQYVKAKEKFWSYFK